jgi:hypothetical protein
MNFDQHECGLINIPHSRDMYAVFHQSQTDEPLRGICFENDGNEVRLSSIPIAVRTACFNVPTTKMAIPFIARIMRNTGIG